MKVGDKVQYCGYDVYGMLENLCVDGDYPFIVITGNSNTMKKVVEKVVSSFDLRVKEKLGNNGRLLVCES
jgi:hypothetical protein